MTDGSAEKELVDRQLMDTRTAIVAEVTFCDPVRMVVNVKPLYLERKMAEEDRAVEFEEMSEIIDVPLLDVCGIRYLIPVGEHGLLIFHDVDLDKYKLTRERLELASSRFHDYNDAMFIPCELAQVDRPDPYATLEGRLFKFHTNVQVEKDVQIDGNLIVLGDVIAGSQLTSLVNLGLHAQTHTHTGNLSYATSTPAPPPTAGTAVFVPYEEPPKVG